MEANSSSLFKQHRSYNPITDPVKKEKIRLRNLEWNTKNPIKKHEGQKRWRLANKQHIHDYRVNKYVEKFGTYPPEKTSCMSKLEQTWKNVIELEFPKIKFKKIRPDWLKNHVTGCNLELDLYHERFKLAIEISGDQHFRFTPKFHKDYDDFLYQKFKDELKANRCSELGIYLIVVDKNSKPSEIFELIKTYIDTKVYFI